MWYDKLKIFGNVSAAVGVAFATIDGCAWCAMVAVGAKIVADLVKSIVLTYGGK